ncbi:MAG: hypothetical protein ACI90G_001375 [Urechidicola sp.]|jgi:hypothetical protein
MTVIDWSKMGQSSVVLRPPAPSLEASTLWLTTVTFVHSRHFLTIIG